MHATWPHGAMCRMRPTSSSPADVVDRAAEARGFERPRARGRASGVFTSWSQPAAQVLVVLGPSRDAPPPRSRAPQDRDGDRARRRRSCAADRDRCRAQALAELLHAVDRGAAVEAGRAEDHRLRGASGPWAAARSQSPGTCELEAAVVALAEAMPFTDDGVARAEALVVGRRDAPRPRRCPRWSGSASGSSRPVMARASLCS